MGSNTAAARTSQGLLSTTLLAVVVLTCVAVGVAAHFTPVFANRLASEIQRHREVDGMYRFNGGYIDGGDDVLVGQIPVADYSRGGVYFIGASETKMSIMPYLLPPAERALIHNFSLGDLRHSDVLHYVRMLVEEVGLLSAGGEKTTVFLGMSNMMGRPRDWNRYDSHYVPELFERHGFYTFDEDGGIHKVAMSPVERFLRRERIYASRFLHTLTAIKSRVAIPVPEDHEKLMVYQMDDDWRDEMVRQAAYVGETIDYLRARGVRVIVLFPPIQSWQKQMPYQKHYRDVLQPVLNARQVDVVDFSHLLPDSEFGDSVHARYSGQIKLHEAYAKLARDALSGSGPPPAKHEMGE
jgi:hypothetical protein